MDVSYTNSIRIPIMMAASAGIIVWAIWIFYNKERWLYAIIPLSYLLHVLIFTICAQLGALPPDVYRMWNDSVRLHGIFMAIIGGVAWLLLVKRESIWR